MEINIKIATLTQKIREFVKTNCKILQLKTVENTSVIKSNIVSFLVMILLVILFIFFVDMGISYYLSTHLKNNYLGFTIVAGFYMLLAIVIFINKRLLIEKPS